MQPCKSVILYTTVSLRFEKRKMLEPGWDVLNISLLTYFVAFFSNQALYILLEVIFLRKVNVLNLG